MRERAPLSVSRPAGDDRRHQTLATLQVNLLAGRRNALCGKPCRGYGGPIKVRTHSRVRYSDALIACGPARPKSTFAPDPVVIFEILGPSWARLDPGAKNADRRTIASLRRYVMRHQTQAAAEIFRLVEIDENVERTA